MRAKARIGINGFGRIGRMVLRAAMTRDDLEVVAVNDLQTTDHLAYLLKYDSVQGAFSGTISTEADSLYINDRRIAVTAQRDPRAIPWSNTRPDVVIEATGRFLTRELSEGHLQAGAGKVLISAPPKDDTPVFVIGVNAQRYSGETIVSNASCTTNCVGTLAKLLHEAFGLDEALMTTVHAATASQNCVDGVAAKDWRFGRSVFNNIIPAATGAARMVGKVLPELDGRINGMAVRVPIADVSMLDLTCRLSSNPTYLDILEVVRDASENAYRGIIGYSNEAVVSSDLCGNAHSAVLDANAGLQTAGGLTKLIAWYDNEWGYANRCLDLSALLTSHPTNERLCASR